MIHARKNFVVRTVAANPMTAAPVVREILATVDPSIAIDNVMPMEQRLSDSAGGERFWKFLS